MARVLASPSQAPGTRCGPCGLCERPQKTMEFAMVHATNRCNC